MGWNLRVGVWGLRGGGRAGQDRAGHSRGVEAARDVGLVDHGEEFEVGTAGPVAVGFAEVDVQKGFVLDRAHGAVLVFYLMVMRGSNSVLRSRLSR